MLALASHDLGTANAVLDPAVAPVVAHRSTAPLHQFGLWALLRTVTDDRGTEARLLSMKCPPPAGGATLPLFGTPRRSPLDGHSSALHDYCHAVPRYLILRR